jgi:two-component system heavy metal sensor histidine kinase CusS
MSSKTEVTRTNSTQRRRRHWSIARRLTWFYVGSTFTLIVLSAIFLDWSLAATVVRDGNVFLANVIQQCRGLLNDLPPDTHSLAREVQTEPAASHFIEYYVRILDGRGRVVLATPRMNDILPVPSFPAAVEQTAVPTRGTVWRSATGDSYLLMAARAQVNGANPSTGVVQVALNVSTNQAILAGYRWKLLTAVLLGLLFSCIASVIVTRNGLRPLEEIARATERISASHLHERIVRDGWPSELASLARSFDRMLDRLEDSFRRLSQFSADLAHELRTPINNLRGEAGVALSRSRTPVEYRRTLESSLEEYARLARLIDNLLFLARADGATTRISRLPCDAKQAAMVLLEYYQALAADCGIEVRCEGQGLVYAEPVLFRQAVSNLVANALNHTPPGGHVLVRVGERENGDFEVVVRDTGCGIPAEHLPRIFDRHYRGELARSQHGHGAGLGLAIVRSIMTLHGGSAEVQSQVGAGTTFTLTFPSVRPAHHAS